MELSRVPVSGKPHVGANRILAHLPDNEGNRLKPYMEKVTLVPGRVVQEEGEPTRYAYFPDSGMVSLVVRLAEGESVEVTGVGCEGMSGLSAFLGAPVAPVQAIAQIAGSAHRMAIGVLRRETENGSVLRSVLARYANARFAAASQSVACNRFHTVPQRCARWMLAAHDRIAGDEFELTHEFLSMMLGVRRAGVSEAIGALRDGGLIEATRGRFTIVNRPGLERASCECYRIIREEMENVFAGAGR